MKLRRYMLEANFFLNKSPLTGEVLVLLGAGVCEVLELLKEKRVLEDALDGFDEVGLQREGVLPPGVARLQELHQGRVALAYNQNSQEISLQIQRICIKRNYCFKKGTFFPFKYRLNEEEIKGLNPF